MKGQNKETEKQCDINVVSSSCFDRKTMTEIEYLEYMSKKTKTVNIILYPDGSKGELNIGAIVLL